MATFSIDKPEPGIYYGIGYDDYRACTAIAKSDLDRFIAVKDLGRKGVLGSAFHARVLEGQDQFRERYAMVDTEFDLRTTDGKATATALREANPGKALMRPKDTLALKALLTTLATNPATAKWLAVEGQTEVTVIGDILDAAGAWCRCKARIDKVTERSLSDLKMTHFAFQNEFVNAISEYGYAVQGAWYTDVYGAIAKKYPPFFFVCASSNAPGMRENNDGAWVQLLTNEQLAFGRAWYRSVLALYGRYGKEKASA